MIDAALATGLSRRDLVHALGGAGALATLPLPALARLAPMLAQGTPRYATLQALLDRYVAQGKLPGAVASIGRGTQAPAFMAAGTLAVGSRAAMTPDSLFRIYSMTKPVTAMAAMILIDEGRLRLDQPLADILPAFASPRVLIDPPKSLDARPATRAITIRHLLTHTAGLGYSIITKGPLLAEYLRLGLTPASASRQRLPGTPQVQTAPSLAVFADRLATLPLIADPGTKWSYSVALDLMGRVIEVVAGVPFDAFLQRRLFDPLGMTSTFFRVPARELARMTTNYGIGPVAGISSATGSGGGRIVIDEGATTVFADQPAFPFGGAGLVSSPRDYDRFLAMLAGGGALGGTRLMRAETAALAMSNLLPAGTDTAGSFVAGQGFGAGGRVTIATTPGGAGLGTYGWGGAAATVAWVDRVRGVRGGGYAQYMPDQALPFTRDVTVAAYHDVNAAA